MSIFKTTYLKLDHDNEIQVTVCMDCGAMVPPDTWVNNYTPDERFTSLHEEFHRKRGDLDE